MGHQRLGVPCTMQDRDDQNWILRGQIRDQVSATGPEAKVGRMSQVLPTMSQRRPLSKESKCVFEGIDYPQCGAWAVFPDIRDSLFQVCGCFFGQGKGNRANWPDGSICSMRQRHGSSSWQLRRRRSFRQQNPPFPGRFSPGRSPSSVPLPQEYEGQREQPRTRSRSGPWLQYRLRIFPVQA